MKYIFILILFFSIYAFPQSERYTKGAENGYAWLAMDDPTLMYSISKENYLNSILNRYKITGEKHPGIASLGCSEDINNLFEQGKSDEISLENVVNEINVFYLQKENLVIPIIFAYCYTIKKFADASSEELIEYRNEVLIFCYDED